MQRMAVKSIYVSKAYESFWARAEAKVSRQRGSMAEYVGRLIRKDVMSGGVELTVEEALNDIRASLDALQQVLAHRAADGG